MTAAEGPPPDASELEVLRREHANIAQLLLVLESHLALMSEGEGFDTRLMLDTAGYLVEYIGRFHRTDGEDLCRRLERAIADERLDRRELVRLGFSYCAALRRTMLLEEAELAGAADAPEDPAVHEVRRAAEEHFRAQFEELTQRTGCDCAYVRTG